MPIVQAPRLIRLTVFVLVTLGCWLLDVSQVQAGCGDYVMIGNHAAAQHRPTGMASSLHESSPLDQNLPAPSRCPGGICSQRDHLPVSPPAPTITLEHEQWASLVTDLEMTGPQVASMNRDSFTIRPDNHGLSILRPPR